MKRTKSILAVVLALALVLVSGIVAFAASDYSITVKNSSENISIVGNTYKAYKIFDAAYAESGSVAYKVNSDFENFEYAGKKGGELIDYLATLENNSAELDAFAKAAFAYAEVNSIAPAGTVIAESETAVIELNSAGYYLVTGTATAPESQTVTAACALTTAKPTAEINVKADAPKIEKKIVEGDQKVDVNNASIGQVVNYEITSKVPNMNGYTKYFFVMQDTLSKGLTYNNDIKVTLGSAQLADGTDYDVNVTDNADGTTSIEIVFKNFIQYKAQAGADIVVTYSATVNEKAELDPTVGNPNTIKLIYSNNPNVEGEGEPTNPDKPKPGTPVGETPEDTVKTYVTGIKVIKVDENGNALVGAKFEIKGTAMKTVLVNKEIFVPAEDGTYYMLKDGTYTTTAPLTDPDVDGYNAESYDSVTQKYNKITVIEQSTVPENFVAVGYVNSNGVLTFEGLAAGTYTITELVAPTGYNILKDPITVVITADATLESCTWTATADGNSLTMGADHLFEIKVENKKGQELPTTGGIGTTIFYVVGAVLVAAAGILLITRKRMSKVAD